MLVRNRDHDSSEYERIRWTPRPSHADLSTYLKYGGFNDYRGGGRSSGRITAGYVMAGSIAKKVLNKTWRTEVIAYTKEIGGIQAGELSLDEIRKNVKKNPVRCGDPIVAEKMVSAIKKAYVNGDSLGGNISCIASNMPPGVGEPVFNTLEGELSKALFSIPAVKAVDFGLGHQFSSLSGSESNDPYIIRKGKIITETNKGGGILGGISFGMPIKLNVTFKPTPSIRRKQRTIDLRTMEETTIEVIGRHDPCIVPRAIPVVESIVSIVLVDQGLRAGLIPTVMEK
jgi:chorismate synthase